MLYSRKVLKDITLPYSQIPLKRYLHKYEIGELKKLKMHEREFLFEHMILMNNDEMFNRKATFDLRKIEEAKEYLFFMIILTYHAKDIIDFDSITFGYNRKKYLLMRIKRIKDSFMNICLYGQTKLNPERECIFHKSLMLSSVN